VERNFALKQGFARQRARTSSRSVIAGRWDPLGDRGFAIAIGEAAPSCAGDAPDASKIYEFTIGFGKETEDAGCRGAGGRENVQDHRPH